jgi:hypothetical protein
MSSKKKPEKKAAKKGAGKSASGGKSKKSTPKARTPKPTGKDAAAAGAGSEPSSDLRRVALRHALRRLR